jgi:hypothetical protein
MESVSYTLNIPDEFQLQSTFISVTKPSAMTVSTLSSNQVVVTTPPGSSPSVKLPPRIQVRERMDLVLD